MAWRNVKPITEHALKQSMYDIIQRAKLRKKLKDSGKRHQKALFGAFRKWFETTLNNLNDVNANVTEKLMGHRNDLRSVYYNPDIQERFKNFKLAIPDLTIDSTKRQQLEIKAKQVKIDELQIKNKEKQKLEDKVARQDQAIVKILSDLEELKKKN